MDKYTIEGPNKLKGEVSLSGAKNAVLKLMAASILTNEEIILENVPKIEDVLTMVEVLKAFGVKADFIGKNVLRLKSDSLSSFEATFDLVSKMRASIIVLGPLLARLKKSRVALPGGCQIGLRKIDFHIKGLEHLGAKIEVGQGFISASCPKLTGAKIHLDFPSVGATENILMAAVLAKGTTVIENAAREPELVELANFLNLMGAKIRGLGSSTLRIEGVNKLHGLNYRVINDRIEAGTFLAAAAITEGDIFIRGADASHLTMVIDRFKEMGFIIEEDTKGLRIKSPVNAKAVDIVTLPFPGFPTDLQGLVMAVLTLKKGTSIITENVFENRFLLVDELVKMGANIATQNHHAIIKGVKKLKGSQVSAPDLRGGAALVVAGLAAYGNSTITEIFHIDRGYEKIEKKFEKLGAKIKRQKLERMSENVILRR